jgi:hypothetical protein
VARFGAWQLDEVWMVAAECARELEASSDSLSSASEDMMQSAAADPLSSPEVTNISSYQLASS